MSIRILLTDDHRLVRESLRSLLEKEPGVKIVGEAEDGQTAVRLARELNPDVIVMNITMSHLNGIEATRQIVTEIPGVKVLGLSMHSDKRFVVGILRAGATGYLLKDCAFEELARAIRCVAAHQTYLSPKIANIVRKEYLSRFPENDFSVFSVLTAGERQVLQLLAEGKTTRYIASHLGVSVKTVETYRQHLMDKLGFHNIAELTKYAIREGLTPLES
ncbi:MAG: response regulator transcription factor [Candidatus Aerophobetes bacterium]|nr:response regulator transcription factor [Candidatus Aerophobetes bacterium]